MTKPTTEISIVWNDEDIRAYAADMNLSSELTDKEIGKVLDSLYRNHDAETGISWETIGIWIDEVVGERNCPPLH